MRNVEIVKRDSLHDKLKGFARLYDEGAVFVVSRVGKDEPFVQFALENTAGSMPNLVFGFPDSAWSHKVFDKIVLELVSLNIQFDYREGTNSPVCQFIEARIGHEELKVAYEIMDFCIDLLDIETNSKVQLFIEGPWNKENIAKVHEENRDNMKRISEDSTAQWYQRLLARVLLLSVYR